MQRDDVLQRVVVLVGRGRQRLQVGQVGQSSQRQWRRNDRVPLGGWVVLVLVLVNKRDLGF